MLQIRQNVFETNSSSTHSITICSSDEYHKWVDGDFLFAGNCYLTDKKFVTIDEAIDIVRKYESENDYEWSTPLEDYYYRNDIKNGVPYTRIDDVPEELILPYLAYHDMYTYESYFDEYCKWFEIYKEDYTTEHGDEIVAFGFYGRD